MAEAAAPDAAALWAWAIHAGAYVEADALRASLPQGSLPEAFHATALRHPDRPALWFNGRTWTHADIDRRSAAAAGWLADRGVKVGDRVLISSHNSAAMIVAYLATLRLGATVVLAGPTLTTPELTQIAEVSGAIAGLAAGVALDRLRATAGVRRGLAWVASLTGELEEGEAAAVARGRMAQVSRLESDSIAMLAFTSGTTGRAKGVPLSHGNLLASIRAAMLAWRWSGEDVLVHALPLSHQHGLSGLHATLLAGSRLALLEHFDVERLLAVIAKQAATVLFAVPAMYQRLSTLSGSGSTLRALRLAVSGSAPLSSELARRLQEQLGQPPLERYGTTESGLDISNPIDGPRVVGAVGLPLPGVEVRIARGDGAAVDNGDDGEILVRGPQVFRGYWNDDAATAEAFHPGGWFRTGDIGRVDPATQYVQITGRSKELIISGGLNVYPREVEAVLESYPDVAEAAVAGVPSDRWGEEVTGWVVPVQGRSLDVDALVSHLRSALAAYKCPKRIHVVDRLPRNAVGKLLRRELVDLSSHQNVPARHPRPYQATPPPNLGGDHGLANS